MSRCTFSHMKRTQKGNQATFATKEKLLVHCYHKTYDDCRFTEERDHLFEAMRTRNAMIKFNINGTPLLIFSSKLLDKSSQSKPSVCFTDLSLASNINKTRFVFAVIIKMQKKTNNFLWGIFLLTKKSLALLPGTSNQNPQHFDDGDVVDNDTEVG